MSDPKEGMRKRLHEIRQSLSRSQVELKSQQILSLVKTAVPWSEISTLHIFLPITKMNEPETAGILSYIWTEHPYIKTYSSVIMPESKGMLIVPIDANTPIVTNSIGIPEPLGERSTHPKLDLIFIPLVGFDANGNRIGFGGGYYDRFLKKYPKARKVGLAFEGSKVANVAAREYDIPLDKVITEVKVYNF